MSRLPSSCLTCGAPVKAGESRCELHRASIGRRSSCRVCHALTDGQPYCTKHQPTEADRNARFPYREGYRDPEYRRAGEARFKLARGLCEFCGRPLDPKHYERHHMDGNPRNNRVVNLRVCHHKCHPRRAKVHLAADWKVK
jgi:hypothetical protein